MPEMFKDSLLYALCLLKDYLDEVVLCGGWVPFIYREYVLENKPKPPLRTKDIDLAAGEIIEVKKNKSIDRILEEAGFKPVQIDSEFRISSFGKSGNTPPLIKFEYKEKGLDIEVGFLTDLRGRGDVGVKKIQEELTAEALRYVSVILDNFRVVEISDKMSTGLRVKLKIKIPRPAAFIYQKGLTFVKRTSDYKKGKDLCYIYDLLENYRELHAGMYKEFKIIAERYPAKWFRRFIGNMEDYFDSSDAAGPILVRQQYMSDMEKDLLQRRICSVFKDFTDKLKRLAK